MHDNPSPQDQNSTSYDEILVSLFPRNNMSENLVNVEIVAEFYDVKKDKRRTPDEGVVQETAKRARDFVAIGVGRIVEGEVEEKRQSGSPENKSLSGPPENKRANVKASTVREGADVSEAEAEDQGDGLDEMTVEELQSLAEERGIELPSGYVKKVELVNIIRSES